MHSQDTSQDAYSHEQREILRNIARESILYGLEHQQPMPVNSVDYPDVFWKSFQEKKATFVTLNIEQSLRGCIGSLSPYRGLAEDIAHNAYAAAFSDPRFAPLQKKEFALLEYHLSVLSDSSPMHFSSEADLLTQIRPAVDGLILQDKGKRGTFLPSVWSQLPNTEEFLHHLKQKAGLPADYWSDTLQISRYTVEMF